MDVWWVGDSVNVGTAVLSWTIVLALDGLNIGSFDGGILGLCLAPGYGCERKQSQGGIKE